jgi:hypothetical protein
MKNQNSIITIIAIIAIILGTWKAVDWYYASKIDASAEILRREKIKSSELTQINEGLYTKLAADTLSIKELEKLNDSLKLELKNPEVVTVVKWKIKWLEKPVDSLTIKDSIVTLVDTYPDINNPFVTYRLKLNLSTAEGVGSWDFTPQEIILGIGQNEDGTYSVNTKVPDFLEITGLDVSSLPMQRQKPDDFGWLLGVTGGKRFLDETNLYGVSGGIRYKKLYLDTNLVFGNDEAFGLLGVKLEF